VSFVARVHGGKKRAFILENVCWFHYKSRRLQERERW
jgi:hypothetical protein